MSIKEELYQHNTTKTTLYEDHQKVLEKLAIYTSTLPDSPEKKIYEVMGKALGIEMRMLSIEEAKETDPVEKLHIMYRRCGQTLGGIKV